MVDHVKIAGFERGIPSWATEDTQEEIRDLIRTHVQLSEDARTHESKGKQTLKQILGFEKKKEKTDKQRTNILTKILDATIVQGASFETLFKDTLQSMTRALGEIPLIGGTLVGLSAIIMQTTQALIEQHETYRDIFDTGMSLNGSFINLISSAADAQMTVSGFAAAVQENSVAIRRLSTSTELGVNIFGNLSRQVRTNLEEFGQLQLTQAELNEYLGDYLESQRLMGMNEKIDEMRRSAALTEYLQELTKLSQMTGKQRKQLNDMINEQLQDDVWAATMQELPETIRNNLTKVATRFGGLDSAMGKFVQDIVTMGVPLTESSQKIAALMGDFGPEFENFIKRIQNGAELTGAELDYFTTRLKQAAENTNLDGLRQAAAAGDQALRDFLRTVVDLRTIVEPDEVDKFNKQFTDLITAFFGNLEQFKVKIMQPFLTIFGKILAKLNEKGGLFDILTGALSKAANNLASTFQSWVESGTFNTVLNNFIGFINWSAQKLRDFAVWAWEFITNLFTPEGRTQIMNDLSANLESLGEWIGRTIVKGVMDYFFGGGPDDTAPEAHPMARRETEDLEARRKLREQNERLRNLDTGINYEKQLDQLIELYEKNIRMQEQSNKLQKMMDDKMRKMNAGLSNIGPGAF